jgi:dipeptidyl aminopeptidase/acylaminoacyl peptidase
MSHPQSNVGRVLSVARTVLALALGFVTVQVVLFGTILLVMPGLLRGADFPAGVTPPPATWPSVDTVRVAPPTGAAETDRANVQAAFDAVHPGGTILFAPGTYMLGAGARLAVPDVTVLGHREGTVLRGCDPEAFATDDAEIEEVVFGCTGLYVQAERQTIRGLTFEYTWHGIVVGPYPTSAEEAATFWEGDGRPEPYPAGGHRIEGNTFRLTPNGLRVLGTGSELSVVRDNDFIDVFHAIGIYGAPLHFIDNRVTVSEAEKVPFSRHPGSAIIVAAGHTDCSGHVVAGNRIDGYPDPIYVIVRSGETCRGVAIRANTIRAARVKIPEAWSYVPTAADSTMVGAPITLMNRTEPQPRMPGADSAGILEDILVEANRIVGAEGLGILVQGVLRSRIVANTITGIQRRAPFPGITWDGFDQRWQAANGSGIWLSPGSDNNEIAGNRFEDVSAYAVVVEGDSNRVSSRAADAVRDLGSGNRIEGRTAPQPPQAATAFAPAHTVHDVETFFDTENVFPARWDRGVFSHDERRVLVASDRTGTFNAFAIPVVGGEPEQLTRAVDGSVLPISWFPHDDRFLYEGDEGGDERSVLRVRELDGSSTELSPAEDVRAEFVGWSADGSAFWVATDERARPVMDVYRYSSDDYERAMIFRNDGGYLVAGISATGRWIALQRTNSNTDTDLYLHDLETGETITMSPDVEGVRHRFMDFSADSDIAYYGTDQFGEFQEVWQYQISTGERSAVEQAEWDVRRLRISAAGSYRIAQITEDAFPAVRVTHVETGERLPFPELPVGEVGGGLVFSPSETKLVLAGMGPRTPGDLYLLDLSNPRAPPRQLTRALSPAIDPADLVEAERVRFASSDGVEIPGILYRPHQASHEQRVPALVYLHGGPGGTSTRTWDERLQHLVNHGYAVLDVNYRGSEGYGKTFLTLDDRRHGEADVQDILAARDWLAGLDWVDGDRIGLMGDSFGGFLTLATLALRPGSFRLGIAGHPSINWISTLTIARDRLGPAVEAQYAEIGHPERDAERLRRISPYFHADRVVKPILLYHGANDPKYDLSEVDEFVARIRARGVPVEYMLFENEGHYLVNLENRVAVQEAWLAFLERYLRS